MPKTRRKTDPTTRLSDQMKEVLKWVHKNQMLDPGQQDFVPWRPSVFIGENPTSSKTTALSNTLKRLEERGLLNRYSITYKDGEIARVASGRATGSRMRTTHVNLSDIGSLFVQSLMYDDFNYGDYEAHKQHAKMVRQAEGLRFALVLLTREQFKQMTESGTAPEALSTLEAINKWLGPVPKAELEQRTRSAVNTIAGLLQEFDSELGSGS